MADKIMNLNVKNGVDQQTQEPIYTSYPIGSDAKYIDTFSNLNLESLFKIGQSCWTETTNTEYGPVIIKKFGNIDFKEDPTQIPQGEERINIDFPYYELKISYIQNEDIFIKVGEQVLPEGQEQWPDGYDYNLYLSDENNNNIVDRAAMETDYDYTQEELHYITENDRILLATKKIYQLENTKVEKIYITGA